MNTKSKFRYLPSLDNSKFKFSRRDYLFGNNHDDRVFAFNTTNVQKQAGDLLEMNPRYTKRGN